MKPRAMVGDGCVMVKVMLSSSGGGRQSRYSVCSVDWRRGGIHGDCVFVTGNDDSAGRSWLEVVEKSSATFEVVLLSLDRQKRLLRHQFGCSTSMLHSPGHYHLVNIKVSRMQSYWLLWISLDSRSHDLTHFFCFFFAARLPLLSFIVTSSGNSGKKQRILPLTLKLE